ncbi:sulfite exporter TauE/SafE family protein [Spirulina sp. CS-785/01]|uniref:sulfite exporter TauE/SafE family protein n=1 Tax=Spirulina sp. CS-785/01 TaxID=3021716 RepID=UPI00232E2C9D|nr:sulfite exporter TauE/SafE family protein [Spirulina sp. CS-785/01]MDB9313392.1 sulfite exporter TauE/SafE family protein [Spirulina sp. CS-785/01]
MTVAWWILPCLGIIAGLLSGLLGIGGGVVLVPLLVFLGYSYDQSVATSSLAIVLTSFSGSVQNWRMGALNPQKVLTLGLPAILTAQLGAYLVGQLPSFFKEAAFGVLLIVTIFLVSLRKQLRQQQRDTNTPKFSPILARGGTGAVAGLLAGLFGVGGGVIMVPMQMLLLREPIKIAIQTSLGVIVITAISACTGHALQGNVVFFTGISLGIGGLLGAQVSTRYLPKLPDQLVSVLFRGLLVILALYFFWRAWNSYLGR